MTKLRRFLIPAGAAACAIGLFLLFTGGLPAPRAAPPLPSWLDGKLEELRGRGKGDSDGALFILRYRAYLAQIAAGNAHLYGKEGRVPPVYDALAFMANMDADRVDLIVANTLAGRDAFEGLTGLVERAYAVAERGIPESFIMYLPRGYTAARKWPLVVVLHGYGTPTFLNPLSPAHAAFLRDCEERGVIMVAPNGLHHPPYEQGGWIDAPSEADAMRVVAIVRGAYAIDPERIYVAGYSMGGYGAVHLGTGHKDTFAALAEVCGGMPLTVAGGRAFDGLAVWMAHGDADRVIAVAETRGLKKMLDAAGVPNSYEEYPGCDHAGAVEKAFGEGKMLAWLLAHPKSR